MRLLENSAFLLVFSAAGCLTSLSSFASYTSLISSVFVGLYLSPGPKSNFFVTMIALLKFLSEIDSSEPTFSFCFKSISEKNRLFEPIF